MVDAILFVQVAWEQRSKHAPAIRGLIFDFVLLGLGVLAWAAIILTFAVR